MTVGIGLEQARPERHRLDPPGGHRAQVLHAHRRHPVAAGGRERRRGLQLGQQQGKDVEGAYVQALLAVEEGDRIGSLESGQLQDSLIHGRDRHDRYVCRGAVRTGLGQIEVDRERLERPGFVGDREGQVEPAGRIVDHERNRTPGAQGRARVGLVARPDQSGGDVDVRHVLGLDPDAEFGGVFLQFDDPAPEDLLTLDGQDQPSPEGGFDQHPGFLSRLVGGGIQFQIDHPRALQRPGGVAPAGGIEEQGGPGAGVGIGEGHPELPPFGRSEDEAAAAGLGADLDRLQVLGALPGHIAVAAAGIAHQRGVPAHVLEARFEFLGSRRGTIGFENHELELLRDSDLGIPLLAPPQADIEGVGVHLDRVPGGDGPTAVLVHRGGDDPLQGGRRPHLGRDLEADRSVPGGIELAGVGGHLVPRKLEFGIAEGVAGIARRGEGNRFETQGGLEPASGCGGPEEHGAGDRDPGGFPLAVACPVGLDLDPDAVGDEFLDAEVELTDRSLPDGIEFGQVAPGRCVRRDGHGEFHRPRADAPRLLLLQIAAVGTLDRQAQGKGLGHPVVGPPHQAGDVDDVAGTVHAAIAVQEGLVAPLQVRPAGDVEIGCGHFAVLEAQERDLLPPLGQDQVGIEFLAVRRQRADESAAVTVGPGPTHDLVGAAHQGQFDPGQRFESGGREGPQVQLVQRTFADQADVGQQNGPGIGAPVAALAADEQLEQTAGVIIQKGAEVDGQGALLVLGNREGLLRVPDRMAVALHVTVVVPGVLQVVDQIIGEDLIQVDREFGHVDDVYSHVVQSLA